MSYNMPNVFSSEFQSNSTKIEDFKINPINQFNPISTRGWVTILNLLLGISYNMLKRVGSKFQSPSIKMEDFSQNICVCMCVWGKIASLELCPSGQLKTITKIKPKTKAELWLN